MREPDPTLAIRSRTVISEKTRQVWRDRGFDNTGERQYEPEDIPDHLIADKLYHQHHGYWRGIKLQEGGTVQNAGWQSPHAALYSEMAWIIAHNMEPGDKLAMIGAGAFELPTLIAGVPGIEKHVFEIVPELKTYNEAEHPSFITDGWEWHIGDWKDNIGTERFDIIVYDLGGRTPRKRLSRNMKRHSILLGAEM